MRDSPGQHAARSGPTLRELLPWVPSALGVMVLIALLIVAAGRFSAKPEQDRAVPPAPFLPVPAPTFTPPPPSLLPPASPSPSVSARPDRQVTASATPRPGRTATRTSPPSTTTAPAPAPAAVSGRYRVVESFDDGFIGEVLIADEAGRDSDWRVELRFPAAVGDLITSWVESAPQATLRRSGAGYIWTSGVPVPARGQVALRFHFARSGTGDQPTSCTVNGQTCSGTG